MYSRAPLGFSNVNGPRWTPLRDGTIIAGDVVVIRYEGPKGGPGMREMLAITGRAGQVRQAGRLGGGRRGLRLGRPAGVTPAGLVVPD